MTLTIFTTDGKETRIEGDRATSALDMITICLKTDQHFAAVGVTSTITDLFFPKTSPESEWPNKKRAPRRAPQNLPKGSIPHDFQK